MTLPDQFSSHARAWNRLGPPLRPAPEDVRVAERYVEATPARPGSPFRALILGVTPELACMRWPENTELVAVDRSRVMIDAVWPAGRLPCRGHALCADWSEVPLESGSIDAVLGDGSFTLLAWPDAQRGVLRELRRLIAERGRLVLRVFVLPERREDVAAVLRDLDGGRIGSFHVFRWRLAMSLQRELERGVSLRDVWQLWQRLDLDRDALALRHGWPRDSIDSIDAYRQAEGQLWFPTLSQARALLAEEFRELDCHLPGYELGACFPTLRLAPRS